MRRDEHRERAERWHEESFATVGWREKVNGFVIHAQLEARSVNKAKKLFYKGKEEIENNAELSLWIGAADLIDSKK